jgi:hypothetical protein
VTNHRIAIVYVFENGMTAVFDHNGRQLPDYQGPWEEVRDLIERDKPASAPIERNASWHKTSR